MGSVKIPYYVVIKGRGYWSPKKAMKAHGFQLVSCGVDGPKAWAVAKHWADKWDRFRKGMEPSPDEQRRAKADPDQIFAMKVYPARSLGEAFGRFRRMEEWRKKAPRTREEWDRAWARIDPFCGDTDPRTISLEDISGFRLMIEQDVSVREAHRVIKVWRALWRVAAALKYCERDADPSLAIRNEAAKGRMQTWTEGEAVRLVKAAWRRGYRGLAAALAVMWDSQLSPGDVRALTASQVAGVRMGGGFLTERAKTGRRAGAALSKRSATILRAYLDGMGVDLHAETPIFWTRGHSSGDGRPWPPRPYTKDQLGDDFRLVRQGLFGEVENRKMLDFRRSGAVEAIQGNAEPAKLAHAMGNTLSQSNALFETYAPANVQSAIDIAEARRRGRAQLRGTDR